jgi:hypothetical protein
MGSFGSNANKTKMLTLGFKGLTLPPSTRSTVAAFQEEVLGDNHPRSLLVGARRRSHHCLCAGRSTSCRAGRRHAQAFTSRGTEPSCAHPGALPPSGSREMDLRVCG